MKLDIPTARVFKPLLAPSRYKAAYGGRGSGKSHFFAGLMVEMAVRHPGFRGVCIREVQKSLKESAKLLIEDKIAQHGLGSLFDCQERETKTPGGGIIIYQGMQDHTAESIKSLEAFDAAWCEEAQSLSKRSLTLLRPTIRKDGSELWFSWNPTRKNDAVDHFFRGHGEQAPGTEWTPPTDAIIVKANWSDIRNEEGWFPATLEQERKDDQRLRPEEYAHVWEGEYASVTEGAYYAAGLTLAKQQGRISPVAADPLMTYRAIWDIGGTGAKADACAIWIAQFVGRQILVLDYYEARGQPLAAHVDWLRSSGYAKALCILPHDGSTNDRVHDVSFESALKAAGFEVTVVANQGPGAARMRIEAARRLFPQIWFNQSTTEAGREALGAYHEKRDLLRGIGLGPEHDWACLSGDTEVLTRNGTCRIKELPNQGEALTPCGWKQYQNPRITRKDAPLVEVQFADGLTVKCTPDHLFLTASGWKYAGSLRKGSLIRSSLTQSHSISMAVSIAVGLAIGITVGAARSFIEMCGRGLSAAYRTVATSITETEMLATTPFLTLSAWMQPSIFGLLGGRVRGRGLQGHISARPHGARQRSGTLQRRAVFGIGVTPSEPRAGLSGSESQRTARSVERASRRLLEKAGTRRFTAVRPAKWLRIVGVKKLSERQDVWCLTVPEVACFSLANGATVHNSHSADAFGLMCVAYEQPEEGRKPINPLAFPRGAAAGSWMGR